MLQESSLINLVFIFFFERLVWKKKKAAAALEWR